MSLSLPILIKEEWLKFHRAVKNPYFMVSDCIKSFFDITAEPPLPCEWQMNKHRVYHVARALFLVNKAFIYRRDFSVRLSSVMSIDLNHPGLHWDRILTSDSVDTQKSG